MPASAFASEHISFCVLARSSAILSPTDTHTRQYNNTNTKPQTLIVSFSSSLAAAATP